VEVWSGTTDENGRASFTLTFGKDNYTEEFTLKATIGNEDVTKVVGFFSDTPILFSKAVENIVIYITIVAIIVVAAIGAVGLSIRRRSLRTLVGIHLRCHTPGERKLETRLTL
jgi:hypothetical protein